MSSKHWYPFYVGDYLGTLTASALSVDVREAEHEIISLWRKRTMLGAWREGIVAITNPQERREPEELGADIIARTQAILTEADAGSFQDDMQVTEAILADLNNERKPFSTGITQLDQAMGGGLYPGMAYGFAARKKVGKTVLAATISCNLNQAGVRHLFICGEMDAKQIHQRTLSRLTGYCPSSFRTGTADNQKFQQAIANVALQSPRCTLYMDAPGITFERLRRACASAVAAKGVKGIVLDYWQLVGGKGKNQSTAEHLDAVAQWIADFCRKHQVWAIVMAQINQEGNTRGGEGIRLAFDQVYQINVPNNDVTLPGRWLEMLDTRYTAWMNVGGEESPALNMNDKGPWLEEVQ